ncbi:MAG TPA: hypothetical protein VGK73_25915 [Polyangiaceae bacterium]
MDLGLFLAIGAVIVAGVAAVVGLWMERDPRRPPRWAYSLSGLIVLTTIVTVATSYADKLDDEAREKSAVERYEDLKNRSRLLQEGNDRLEDAAGESKEREEKMQEDIARMLVKLNDMAKGSTDPSLQEFVKAEMGAQSRANENVVSKVAQQVKDSGGDPDAVLASVLPEQELQRVKRSLKEKEDRMSALLERKEKRREREKVDDEEDKKRKKSGRGDKDRDEKSDKDKKDKDRDDKAEKKDDKDRDKDKKDKDGDEKEKAEKEKKDDKDKAEKAAASAAPAAPTASALKPPPPPLPPGSAKPKAKKKD